MASSENRSLIKIWWLHHRTLHVWWLHQRTGPNLMASNRYIPRLLMSDGFIREQVPNLIDIFREQVSNLMASSENTNVWWLHQRTGPSKDLMASSENTVFTNVWWLHQRTGPNLMASSENRSTTLHVWWLHQRTGPKSNRYIPRLYMSDGFIREQVPNLIDIFHDFTCLMASSENRSQI